MRRERRDYDLFDLLRSRFKHVLGFLIEYGGFASDGKLAQNPAKWSWVERVWFRRNLMMT